jgi:hypothetical protein
MSTEKEIAFGMDEEKFKEEAQRLLIPLIEFMKTACPENAKFIVTKDGAELSCALFHLAAANTKVEEQR